MLYNDQFTPREAYPLAYPPYLPTCIPVVPEHRQHEELILLQPKHFFFLFAFLWISSSEFVMRTNLIHRQTMKRLVDLPLEASSITQSDRASPMQALSLSASFWPESSLARWIRSTLSLLWILAFSSKCHLHSALDMQTPGSVMLACWRKKRVYFPFDILRSKLFNYSKFIFSYSNFIYIKT